MLNAILTYLLCFWYLTLFQIYPIVHLHWHEEDGLHTCFMAVEHDQVDHAIHKKLHEDEDFIPPSRNRAGSYLNEFSHFQHINTDFQTDEHHCHHLHVKADFDHFFSKDNGIDKKRKCIDFVAEKYNSAYNPELVPLCALAGLLISPDFYHTIHPNKSPPVC